MRYMDGSLLTGVGTGWFSFRSSNICVLCYAPLTYMDWSRCMDGSLLVGLGTDWFPFCSSNIFYLCCALLASSYWMCDYRLRMVLNGHSRERNACFGAKACHWMCGVFDRIDRERARAPSIRIQLERNICAKKEPRQQLCATLIRSFSP